MNYIEIARNKFKNLKTEKNKKVEENITLINGHFNNIHIDNSKREKIIYEEKNNNINDIYNKLLQNNFIKNKKINDLTNILNEFNNKKIQNSYKIDDIRKNQIYDLNDKIEHLENQYDIETNELNKKYYKYEQLISDINIFKTRYDYLKNIDKNINLTNSKSKEIEIQTFKICVN